MKNWLKFVKDKLKPDNPVFWIVLLVVLNVVAFVIYLAANPADNFWAQLWAYFESAAFKVITISLILPIILFVLEKRFKIAQTIRQNQVIKKQKEEEERKEKRWECIEQTTKVWNQLWDLTSEVVYFKNVKDNDKAKEKDRNQGTKIEDLLIRLRNFTTVAEDVSNMWYHRFPRLPDNYYLSFGVFFDTELNSAETVAWCIRRYVNDGKDAKKKEEICQLQDALKRIVDSIDYLAHHSFINVLKNAKRLLDAGEPITLNEKKTAPEKVPASSDEEKKIKKLRAAINYYVKDLSGLAEEVQIEERKENTPFSFIVPSAETLQKAYRELRQWTLDNRGQEPAKDYPGFENFKQLYGKLKHGQASPYFSKKFVLHLADWLSLKYENKKLKYRSLDWQPPSKSPKS